MPRWKVLVEDRFYFPAMNIVLLHTINDIERVSDHAVNMVEARERISGNIAEADGVLPEAAREAAAIIGKMTTSIEKSLATHDRKASQRVLALEEKLNRLDERVKDYYSESLSTEEEREELLRA